MEAVGTGAGAGAGDETIATYEQYGEEGKLVSGRPGYSDIVGKHVLSGVAGTENIHTGTFAYIDKTGKTVFTYKTSLK